MFVLGRFVTNLKKSLKISNVNRKSLSQKPRKLVNLNKLSSKERVAFMDSFDQIFCDCDGVLWQTGQKRIENTGRAITYLKSKGKDVVFVSNNSLRATENYITAMEEYGIMTTEDKIFHPAKVIAEYLHEIEFSGLIYVIASCKFVGTLRAAGLNVIHGPHRVMEESIQDLSINVFCDDPVTCVIIDVDFNMSVIKLMKANQFLKDPNCLFIGGAADLLIPLGERDIIGPGPFIDLLEQTSKRKATVLGKPGKALIAFLKKRCNVKDPRRAIFIGDTLGTDIRFGNKSGFQTLVVLTGGTTRDDLQQKIPKDQLPDYYIDSIADLIGFK